jgi:hypothetical protein
MDASVAHCDIRTDVDPGIVISIDNAISSALIVNELVTNAAKYAYQGKMSCDGRRSDFRTAQPRYGIYGAVSNLLVSDTWDLVGVPRFKPVYRELRQLARRHERKARFNAHCRLQPAQSEPNGEGGRLRRKFVVFAMRF